MLLERAHELRLLRAALAAARDGAGRLVIIEGPAGIGKTALLAQTCEAAVDEGLQLLSARGHELEHEFAFGVARQLFELPVARATPERQEQLLGRRCEPDPAVTGTRTALDDRDADSPAASRPAPDIGFTLSHGLYWLTANLADSGPLMVALDDAQFADRSSLQCIAYLAARCHELPLLLVLTVRSDEASAADELLLALRSSADTVLSPSVLSRGGVAQLVRERLDEQADSEFCGACARATGGNPFLLGELLTDLAGEQVAATAANAAQVEQASPESVRRVVLGQARANGAEVTALRRRWRCSSTPTARGRRARAARAARRRRRS